VEGASVFELYKDWSNATDMKAGFVGYFNGGAQNNLAQNLVTAILCMSI
jgi:hypothetical protein